MTQQESCFAATRGLCNTCGRLTDAKIVFRSGKVYLVKWCPDHGRTEALTCSDQQWYLDSLAYVKPPTEPRDIAVKCFTGCPDSCGLCAEHEQHTCVPILEITDGCDMHCPICLVGNRGRGHVALSEVKRMLDDLIRYEGIVNMLTISGGEPTTHPQLLEIIDAARRPEIGIVSLSTNGLSLARDESLLRALCERDVVISLQMDGFTPQTYATLRGQPEIAAIKRALIDRILALGGRLSLTMTLAKGVNEHEIPAMLDLLFGHDQVVSMMVQPVAHTARARKEYAADPLDVLTTPDAVALLAAGSRGVLEKADFTPLPCSHPSCFTLTYLLKTESGALVPLPRIIEQDIYIDTIKNQALLNTDTDTLLRVKDSLYTLWSSSGMVPDRDAVLGTVKKLLVDLNKLGRGASHKQVIDLGVQRIKSIFIHHFMDRATFDLSRVIKCCNHYPQIDGRLVPACVRNNFPQFGSGG